MFGYVIPYKEELKVKEYRIFKAYYCSLCKTLGNSFNQAVRFGLNYDFTFLSILLSSLDVEDKPRFNAEGCIANPFKKKLIVKSNKHINYAAHASIIFTYLKLIDDWRDERSVKSIFFLLAYLFPKNRAEKEFSALYQDSKNILEELDVLEKKECPLVDKSADLFAKLMEIIIIPPYINDENQKRILKWLGYNLGRWIYILDAFNDIKEDFKNKSYNPILLQYKYDSSQSIDSFITSIKEPIEFSLIFTLENIAKSFELLDIYHNKTILENIIYMGMRYKMEEIMKTRRVKDYEQSL